MRASLEDVRDMDILAGYEAISADEAVRYGDAAQIVDGQWYRPKWGCDSLQHVVDAMVEEDCLNNRQQMES